MLTKLRVTKDCKMCIPDKATYVYAGLHALLITAISLAHSITRHVTTSIVHLEKRQYDTEQKISLLFAQITIYHCHPIQAKVSK